MWHFDIQSNMNFPAPLAIAGFLATVVGALLLACATLVSLLLRKTRVARWTSIVLGSGALLYFMVLLVLSLVSRNTVLARGQEKYFCEVDCHLAYAVVGVQSQPSPSATHYLVTLRTRFDETTISARRPRDLPLAPSPRNVALLDSSGHAYSPVSTGNTPLTTELVPGQSYVTELGFDVPPGVPTVIVVGKHSPGLSRSACSGRRE